MQVVIRGMNGSPNLIMDLPGLTRAEVETYIHLLFNPRCSLQEVSRERGVHVHAVHATFLRLEKKGWIGRQPKGHRSFFIIRKPQWFTESPSPSSIPLMEVG